MARASEASSPCFFLLLLLLLLLLSRLCLFVCLFVWGSETKNAKSMLRNVRCGRGARGMIAIDVCLLIRDDHDDDAVDNPASAFRLSSFSPSPAAIRPAGSPSPMRLPTAAACTPFLALQTQDTTPETPSMAIKTRCSSPWPPRSSTSIFERSPLARVRKREATGRRADQKCNKGRGGRKRERERERERERKKARNGRGKGMANRID